MRGSAEICSTLLFHSIKPQSADFKVLHLNCYDGLIRFTRGTPDVADSDMVSSVTLVSLTLSTGGCLRKMILVLCGGPQNQRWLPKDGYSTMVTQHRWTMTQESVPLKGGLSENDLRMPAGWWCLHVWGGVGGCLFRSQC